MPGPRSYYRAVFFLAGALFLCCGHRGSGEEVAGSLIVVTSGVRVRAEPATSADEIARLKLGEVVRQLERASGKDRVAGVEEHWYRVATPGGKEGWVFGGFTAPFEAADRDSIHQKIAAERLRVEDAPFADLVDLVRFLTAAAGEAKDRGARAGLELARLLALERAAGEIPQDEQDEPDYANWIKSHEESLVYNEPAGQWLVIPELFWDLQEKYSDLPIAERIAWEASNNPPPGECEGYTPCYLATINLTKGRYLELYPNGAHAQEAMEEIAATLDEIRGTREDAPAPDREERTEALEELNKLRETIGKTSGKMRDDLLKRVDDYSKHYG